MRRGYPASIDTLLVYLAGFVVADDTLFGAIAQLGERFPCTEEVCGSIPHSSTTFMSHRIAEIRQKRMYRRVFVSGFTPERSLTR